MDERDGDGPDAEVEKEQEWLGHAPGPNLAAEEEDTMLGRGLGSLGGGFVRGGPLALPPTPEQLREAGAEEQDYLAKHEAAESARYDAMTPAEREKDYVHPGLLRRIKQWMFGV